MQTMRIGLVEVDHKDTVKQYLARHTQVYDTGEPHAAFCLFKILSSRFLNDVAGGRRLHHRHRAVVGGRGAAGAPALPARRLRGVTRYPDLDVVGTALAEQNR